MCGTCTECMTRHRVYDATQTCASRPGSSTPSPRSPSWLPTPDFQDLKKHYSGLTTKLAASRCKRLIAAGATAHAFRFLHCANKPHLDTLVEANLCQMGAPSLITEVIERCWSSGPQSMSQKCRTARSLLWLLQLQAVLHKECCTALWIEAENAASRLHARTHTHTHTACFHLTRSSHVPVHHVHKVSDIMQQSCQNLLCCCQGRCCQSKPAERSSSAALLCRHSEKAHLLYLQGTNQLVAA